MKTKSVLEFADVKAIAAAAEAEALKNNWAVSIAIVDETPQSQYLAPEFALFAELFQRHGIQAVVIDPASLQLRDGVLYGGALALDLVYNRLTDFELSDPVHAALAQACRGVRCRTPWV